ncbi:MULTISPECIES: hypothetical protein [unclassified Parafrankia]|uniref:hypothetical protein n=1 Tax=unclassified Parafrankia TaxID=2994368 RepID=UPI00103E5590|nr:MULTISPECIES: hypothetical protein [unclassified Parafrankia]TCJ35922.1 hypothetical protein E0504_25475 [Parafrankia sp. BMG5.11]
MDVLPAAVGAPTGRAAAVRTSARTRVQPGGRIATGSGGERGRYPGQAQQAQRREREPEAVEEQ